MKIIRSWRHRPVKKALLIGILYHDLEEEFHLLGTADDAERLRAILIERFGYRFEDVVVMTDNPGTAPHLKPTKTNILHQIRALVAGAQDGDHFLFHFAGHSNQVPNRSGSEDDQQDETIMCSDNSEIKDNKLREMLVNPLPKGASLTAIFDSCYSGTLLDLEHYSCNSVWIPWVNKGPRKSDTLRNRLNRKNAVSRAAELGFEAVKSGELKEPGPAPENTPPLRTHRSQPNPRRVSSTRSRRISNRDAVVELDVQIFQPPQSFSEILGARDAGLSSPKPSRSSLSISTSWLEGLAPHPHRLSLHPDERRWTQSPDGMYKRLCDGTCREKGMHAKLIDGEKPRWSDGHPHVVSISSSRDGQVSWDDVGSSMTLSLIEILKETPNPSLHSLMTRLNHRLHKSTMEMHRYAREAKRISRFSNSPDASVMEIEMDNFQEPQLGSISPLNMEDTFVL